MLGAKIMIILELAKMSSLQFRKKRFLPRGALALPMADLIFAFRLKIIAEFVQNKEKFH